MHLTSNELVDCAEGRRSEASAPHLQSCDVCRRQLADLRAVMSAVAEVDVPEPSPLFWDHFSARVHEAVAADGTPRRSWLDAWSWSRAWVPVAVAGLALLMVAGALTGRLGPRGGFGGASAPQVASVPTVPPLGDPIELPDDPAFDLVADLTEGLDWDRVHDAGFIAHAGEIDAAVRHLTDGERRELRRLLKEELARSGA